MTTRTVYLGHIDIGPDSKLELRRSDGSVSDQDILMYFFRYGLMADQVFMQNAAPSKSLQVFLAYLRLFEAFRRNENHQPEPVFAFVHSDVAADYTEYQLDRNFKLRNEGDTNAERNAYAANSALETAKSLDKDLYAVNLPRRTKSVSKTFRRGLLAFLRMNNPLETGISEESAMRALDKINETEELQTFKLIRSLRLDKQQTNFLYLATRRLYRQANAIGVDAMNSDDSPVWSYKSITNFLNAIGLGDIFALANLTTAETLFKIRRIESFRALREEYFLCQSDSDIDELIRILKSLRLDGRILSTVRQSPGALAALLFEGLNEAKIGYKSINKGAELLTKTVLSDATDEFFAQRCYRLYGYIEQFKRDVSGLVPKIGS